MFHGQIPLCGLVSACSTFLSSGVIQIHEALNKLGENSQQSPQHMTLS